MMADRNDMTWIVFPRPISSPSRPPRPSEYCLQKNWIPSRWYCRRYVLIVPGTKIPWSLSRIKACRSVCPGANGNPGFGFPEPTSSSEPYSESDSVAEDASLEGSTLPRTPALAASSSVSGSVTESSPRCRSISLYRGDARTLTVNGYVSGPFKAGCRPDCGFALETFVKRWLNVAVWLCNRIVLGKCWSVHCRSLGKWGMAWSRNGTGKGVHIVLSSIWRIVFRLEDLVRIVLDLRSGLELNIFIL